MRSLFNRITPLEPIPTHTEANCNFAPGMKCILFDVYGTLLISTSGDIGSTELKGETALKSLKECGFEITSTCPENELGKIIVAEYEEGIIQVHDQSREKGVPYPEVDIEKIWQDVVRELQDQDLIISPKEADFKKLSVTFEFYNNPVYPMPNMAKVLNDLHDKKMKLGIISNAQFFTPMLLKNFLNADVINDDLPLFDQNLLVYSFAIGRAKPDVYLYELMAKNLAQYNITPSECLYIGNDMLNDIYPASKVGFKTVLYAGDTRSLRLRKNHDKCAELIPDFTITDLSQINSIITG
ncbi:MAG: HAD family hydrolase [Planctomycetes bacterium]|nr:HAD family hydrolase [Planctomycetota bacterium]